MSLALQQHLHTQRDNCNYQNTWNRIGERQPSALLAISEIDTKRQALLAESDVLLDGLVDAIASCDIKVCEIVLSRATLSAARYDHHRD